MNENIFTYREKKSLGIFKNIPNNAEGKRFLAECKKYLDIDHLTIRVHGRGSRLIGKIIKIDMTRDLPKKLSESYVMYVAKRFDSREILETILSDLFLFCLNCRHKEIITDAKYENWPYHNCPKCNNRAIITRYVLPEWAKKKMYRDYPPPALIDQ